MATKRLARYARGFAPEGWRRSSAGDLCGSEKAGLGPHAAILARLEGPEESGSWAACWFRSGKPLECDCAVQIVRGQVPLHPLRPSHLPSPILL